MLSKKMPTSGIENVSKEALSQKVSWTVFCSLISTSNPSSISQPKQKALSYFILNSRQNSLPVIRKLIFGYCPASEYMTIFITLVNTQPRQMQSLHVCCPWTFLQRMMIFMVIIIKLGKQNENQWVMAIKHRRCSYDHNDQAAFTGFFPCVYMLISYCHQYSWYEISKNTD